MYEVDDILEGLSGTAESDFPSKKEVNSAKEDVVEELAAAKKKLKRAKKKSKKAKKLKRKIVLLEKEKFKLEELLHLIKEHSKAQKKKEKEAKGRWDKLVEKSVLKTIDKVGDIVSIAVDRKLSQKSG